MRALRAMRRFGPEVAAVATAVAAASYVAWGRWRGGFPLDDAWIHMVYGLSLRREGMLAYNTGIPSTGCTSPLWACFSAVAHAVAGADGPSYGAAACVKALGAMMHAATALIACRLARACASRRHWRDAAALAAGVIVGAVPIGAFAAVSGMEVSLASALLAGVFLALARGRARTAGLLAGIAVAARPESLVAAPVVVVVAAVGRGPGGRARLVRALGAAAAAAIPVAILAARNLAVSGRPFPATYYGKSHRDLSTLGVDLHLGFVDFPALLPPYSHAALWTLAAVAMLAGVAAVARKGSKARARSRVLHARVVLASAALTACLYVAGAATTIRLLAPSVFYFQRYVLPPLPLLVVAAVGAAFSAFEVRLPVSRAASRARPFVLAALVVAALASEISGWRERRDAYAVDVGGIDRVQVAIGRAIAESLPPAAVVWSNDAGAPRYFGQRRVVDLNRLNTPEVFHGFRMKPEWWPDALAVVPAYTTPQATPGTLETILVVRASDDPQDRLGVQALLRCADAPPEGADDRVFVVVHDEPRAAGRCMHR